MHSGTRLLDRLCADSGQSLMEYALLVTAIAIVVVAAAMLLGVDVTGLFGSTAAHV